MTNDPISSDVLHFAQLALASRIQSAVLSIFVGRCQNSGFSLSKLAKALGKTESAMGSLLSNTPQWDLDTVSDLFLAMGCEMSVQIRELYFTESEALPALEQTRG